MSNATHVSSSIFSGRVFGFLALSAAMVACSGPAPTEPETTSTQQSKLLGLGEGEGGLDDLVKVTAHVCGEVEAYSSASSSSEGALSIDGKDYKLAKGSQNESQGEITVGAKVCCDIKFLAIDDSAATDYSCAVQAGAKVTVCGTLEEYVKATAFDDGSLKLDGKNYPIKQGSTVDNEAYLQVGAHVCVESWVGVDSSFGGTIEVSDEGVKVKQHVCGEVKAYAKGTGTANGHLQIDGEDYDLTSNSSVTGDQSLTVGAKVCCDLDVIGSESDEKLVASGSCALEASVTVDICGTLEGYQKATETDDGWMQMDGKKYVIDKGTDVQNEAMLTQGAHVCVHTTQGASGNLGGTAVVSEDGVALSAHVCGKVKSYTSASGDTNGSLSIDGEDYQLDSKSKLQGAADLKVDAQVCCDLKFVSADGNNGNKLITEASCSYDVSVDLDICGTFEGYQKATATDDGWVQLDGKKYEIDKGSDVSGEAYLQQNAKVCLHAKVDQEGDLSAVVFSQDNDSEGQGGSGGSNQGTGGSSGTGGSGMSGSNQGTGGSGVGLGGTSGTSGTGGSGGTGGTGDGGLLGGSGGSSDGGLLGGSSGSTQEGGNAGEGGSDGGGFVKLSLCGQVSAYAAGSASKEGSLSLGGHDFKIHAGAKGSGEASLKARAWACCDLMVSSSDESSVLEFACQASTEAETNARNNGSGNGSVKEGNDSRQSDGLSLGDGDSGNNGDATVNGCSVGGVTGTNSRAGGWLGLALAAGVVVSRRRRTAA